MIVYLTPIHQTLLIIMICLATIFVIDVILKLGKCPSMLSTVISIVLIAVFIISTVSSLTNKELAELFNSHKYKIEVISNDKAILYKDGTNEFSYIEITTKEKNSQ